MQLLDPFNNKHSYPSQIKRLAGRPRKSFALAKNVEIPIHNQSRLKLIRNCTYPNKRKKWELLWEQWEQKQELFFTGTGSEVCQKTPIRRVAELAKSCQNDSREVRNNVSAKDEIHI